jgi:hypothetical protein
MKTPIMTGNDSSAGCPSAARRADATFGIWPRLIVGPPPDQDAIARTFGPEDKKFDEDLLDGTVRFSILATYWTLALASGHRI